MRTLWLACLIAGSVAAADAAWAEQAPPARARSSTPVQDRERLILERWDANANGKVEPEEREAMRADLEARMATLSEEFNAEGGASAQSTDLERRLRSRGAAILKTYDLDGNGELSQSERASFEARRAASMATLRSQMLALYDTNRNGKLDPAERRAMRARR